MKKQKLALLSNVTMDMIARKLKKEYEVYIPNGFDMWISDVLDADSCLYTEEYDAIFLLLDGTEFQELESVEAGASKIALWEKAAGMLMDGISEIPVFISTVDFRENRIRTYAERKYCYEWQRDWYEFVQSAAEQRENVYVLDILQRIMDCGRAQFYSTKMWYMGSMPYAKIGIEQIVREVKLAMRAVSGQQRKIAVLDLDNTLWGGVIGEDGVDGIELSEHGEGRRFFDFQRQLLEMKKRGIVLAINSKNNESDVDAVFEKQPAMLLGRSDFVSKKINWQDKASNLKELEAELNLTEGSFVFIDDNPIEREIVAGQCPDALVPEFPEDTTELLTFAETVYEEMFRGLRLTAEDAKKTQMYLSERERKNIQSQSLDLDSYIRLLEIKIDMHRMKEFELERVHQLCNKTNQFNLTTKRYSVREITAMDGDIFTVTVSDKFGEQGLVAVVICKEKEEHIRLDSFLMSCRVMGRKLEYVIIALLARYYQKPLMGVFRRTSKNAPVEYLYDSLGFAKLSETDEEKSYLLQERTIALPDCYRLILFEGQKIETEKR